MRWRRAALAAGLAGALSASGCLSDPQGFGDEDSAQGAGGAGDSGSSTDTAGPGADSASDAAQDTAGDTGGAGADVAIDAAGPDGSGDAGGPDDVGGPDDAGADTGTDSADTGGGEACLTFAEHIQPIFTASCTGCHGGANPTLGMNLSADQAYGATVGVASASAPAMVRVSPGKPDDSLLYLKLLPDPPVGDRMPLGGNLDDAAIERVRGWIEAGAPETEPFGSCNGGGVGEVIVSAEGNNKVAVGDTLALTGEALDEDGQPMAATLAWQSADQAVLYVDKTGTLLGISAGSTQITATADGVTSDPVTITVIPEKPSATSFAGDVMGVFAKTCAVSECHVDGTEAGDLRLDRTPDQMHEKLVFEEGHGTELFLITPNEPAASHLFLKVTRSTPPVGAQMPFGSAPMPAEDVAIILAWILNGAPFN